MAQQRVNHHPEPRLQRSTLWHLPREIRDLIYGFVLDSPIRPIDPSEARLMSWWTMSDCRLLDTAPLRVCKQVHAELLNSIEEQVSVKIVLFKKWNEREKYLLRTCKNLIIMCDRPECKGTPCTWPRQLEKAVSGRRDLKTLCLYGTGPYVLSHHYMSQFYAFWSGDLDIFEQIRKILRRVPKITATRWVKVRWCEDEQLQLEDDVHVQEYLRLVARIESGLGGSGSGEDGGNK